MDEATVFALTKKRFAREPAVLLGFERIQPERGYPYIMRRANAHVVGLLLRGVDANSLTLLDVYEDEGRLYRREQVLVRIGDRECRCFTYVGIRSTPPP